jgi:hypothetical protein
VKSINDLRKIGYTVHYNSLPFKLSSLLKLDKVTGNISIKPDLFQRHDLAVKIKGVQDPEYRIQIPKNEKVKFQSVLIFMDD